MRTRRAVLPAVLVLAGLSWAVPQTVAMAAGHGAAGGWMPEHRWSRMNDWEPNIAAGSSWL